MKTIKIYYFIYISAILSLIACNSFLDEPQPQQALPSDNAFTTATDLKNHLIGSYSALKLAGFFGSNVLISSDLLADNGEWRGNFQVYREIHQHTMQPNNENVTAMWREGYRAINQANLVLQALETIDDPDLTATLANQYKGEALFLRGVVHFELARFFGLPFGENSSTDPGVPIMLKGTIHAEDITYPSRNYVKEVYDQALADLDTAVNLLPQFTATGRANKYTALGYLAEIYFQMREYSLAADFSQQVIAGPYSLVTSPEDFFLFEDNKEEIWCIKETTTDNPGRNASLAVYYTLGPQIAVSRDLDTGGFKKIITVSQLNAMEQDSLHAIDLRYTTLTSGSSSSTIKSKKYEDATLFTDDAPVLRLAKFKLMRAEALARINGVNSQSIDLLNEIRVRSLRVLDSDGKEVSNGAEYIQYSVSDFADDADALIEAIILERRVELCFEGNRFHDLCRLRRDIGKDPFDAAYDADNLRFPIPQREIDVNPNLEQNPGY